MLRTETRKLSLPGECPGDLSWMATPLFKGPTGILRHMSCHQAVLAPGCSPHPLHAHLQEEIFVVLDGTAEMILARRRDDPMPRIEPLGSGQMVYLPVGQHHTVRNVSRLPVTYLVFKWFHPVRWRPAGQDGEGAPRRPAALAAGVFDCNPFRREELAAGMRTDKIFEGPTDWLDLLHCHVTRAAPGAAFPTHSDPYDSALVLLEGKIAIGEARLSQCAVAYLAASELHGTSNAGEETAVYLSFRPRATATRPWRTCTQRVSEES